jgi:hypothetical protein
VMSYLGVSLTIPVYKFKMHIDAFNINWEGT